MSKTSLKYFLLSIYFHVTPIGTPLFRDYDATMQQDEEINCSRQSRGRNSETEGVEVLEIYIVISTDSRWP